MYIIDVYNVIHVDQWFADQCPTEHWNCAKRDKSCSRHCTSKSDSALSGGPCSQNISGFKWWTTSNFLVSLKNLTCSTSSGLIAIYIHLSIHPIHPYLYNSIETLYVWFLYKYPQVQVPSRPFWPVAAWWRCLPWLESQGKHTYEYYIRMYINLYYIYCICIYIYMYMYMYIYNHYIYIL